ncbi:ankyrin repeat-containing domain protein [Daldinia sp. FL1419]|nr:ankyrin repeat-containing domain protein [Daldinia sp. FL1419]
MVHLGKFPVELIQTVMTAEREDGTKILDQADLARTSFAARWLHVCVNKILYNYNRHNHNCSCFYYAVQKGTLGTLKVATSFGLVPDEPWDNLLAQACYYGHDDIATWLLDRGTAVKGALQAINPPFENEPSKPSLERVICRTRSPALMNCINHRMEEITLRLLSLGADTSCILERDENKFRSALHYAACRNMVETVENLVKKVGLSVDLVDYEGYTPLRYAMRYSRAPDKDTKMIKKLIELGANVNSEVRGELPLTSALSRGRFRQAHELLNAGSKVKPDNPQPGVKFPIHALIDVRYKQKFKKIRPRKSPPQPILRRLIKSGADPTERYVEGSTPLEEAIVNGSTDVMSSLIAIIRAKYGQDGVDTEDLLHYMTTCYDDIPFFVSKVKLLVQEGARLDIPLLDQPPILEWVFRYGEARDAQRLLQAAGKSISDEYPVTLFRNLATDTYMIEYRAHVNLEAMFKKCARLEQKEIYTRLH